MKTLKKIAPLIGVSRNALKAGPKETYFGPSAEELKKIQTEEAA